MALLNRAGATEPSEIADNTGRTAKMTIIYYGGSTEGVWKDSEGTSHNMRGVEERVNGAYSGIIETDWQTYGGLIVSGCKCIDWKNLKLPTSGTSANRPPVAIVPVGYCYLDKTLGKPIWKVGNKWVDATGQEVT